MSDKLVPLNRSRYEADRAWSEEIMPHVKKILGGLLLDAASHHADTKNATDLTIIKMPNLTIAVRVRRPNYDKYKYEFTMRNSTGNTDDTEFEKIKKGAADWFFYGHMSNNNEIHIWHVINLHSFRHAINVAGFKDYNVIKNTDGSSFVAFDLKKFAEDPPILVSSSLKL